MSDFNSRQGRAIPYSNTVSTPFEDDELVQKSSVPQFDGLHNIDVNSNVESDYRK